MNNHGPHHNDTDHDQDHNHRTSTIKILPAHLTAIEAWRRLRIAGEGWACVTSEGRVLGSIDLGTLSLVDPYRTLGDVCEDAEDVAALRWVA